MLVVANTKPVPGYESDANLVHVIHETDKFKEIIKMGKYCSKCGTVLEEGNKFCTKCGAAAPVIIEQPVANPYQDTLPYIDDQGVVEMFFRSDGRINRKRFLIRSVVVFISWLVSLFVIEATIDVLIALGGVLLLVSLVSGWMLSIRRCHVLGLSGWASLLLLMPLLSFFFVLILLCKSGKNGPNGYGADPLS